MKEYKGILFGFFETGMEGIQPSLQDADYIINKAEWDINGLHYIEPGDHLIIMENGEKVVDTHIIGILPWEDDSPLLINREGVNLEVMYDQFCFNDLYVHWLPANIDLALWWDVFFEHSGTYEGILKKK